MPGRKFDAGTGYRYGFNGKENDKDAGKGIQDYGMRIYDSRLGKFLSMDPLFKSYPWNSTYSFAENDVLRSIDLDGLEKIVVTNYINRFNQTTETLITTVNNKDNEPQEMNLIYTTGKNRGKSVALGSDILVRNVKENPNRTTFSTTYVRKNKLNSTETSIVENAPKTTVGQNKNNPNESFQPIFGGIAEDRGTRIIGRQPGFSSSEYNQIDQQISYNIAIPNPPTQSQLNSAVNNFLVGIDLNSSTISDRSRQAANALGEVLLASNVNSATINVTFLDFTGATSFNNRPARNGATFGSNVKCSNCGDGSYCRTCKWYKNNYSSSECHKYTWTKWSNYNNKLITNEKNYYNHFNCYFFIEHKVCICSSDLSYFY